MIRIKKILILSLLSLVISLMFLEHVSATSENYEGNCCLSFDGEDDHIGCNGFDTDEFTIELWVNPKHKIEEGSDSVYGHEKGFLFSVGNGVLVFFDYRYGDLQVDIFHYKTSYMNVHTYGKGGRKIWESGTWYHIVITSDGSFVRSYVNAIINWAQEMRETYITYDFLDVKIGTAIGDDSLAFGGRIDEIRYWSVCRSQTEISNTYDRTLNNTESNSTDLMGYWRLDEDNGDMCQDLSPQHNVILLGESPSNPLWDYPGAPIIPEFPSFLILPLFMITTLLAVIIYRRKHSRLSIVP